MQAIAGEIQLVIAATLLLLVITSFVIAFVFIQQRQYHQYIQEKEEMKNVFQQEILKAQLEVKEQTLHTISQEIHDNIGQILSLVKLNLNTVVFDENSPAAQKISNTRELVGKAIQDLRNLSNTLNPEYVHHQRLSQLLRFELDQMEKTGLYTADLRVQGNEQVFDAQKQLIVFRIAQEIINNVIKHARARHVWVVLHYLPGSFVMSIKDDGTGFDTTALQETGGPEKGTGIRNLYYRARLIGAEFTIDSRPGHGTLTLLSLPIQV